MIKAVAARLIAMRPNSSGTALMTLKSAVSREAVIIYDQRSRGCTV